MRGGILVALALAGATAACTTAPVPATDTSGPSHAADEIIAKEKDPEARRELEQVRDSVDAEMKKQVEALDAEIARLKKENEELRRRAGR